MHGMYKKNDSSEISVELHKHTINRDSNFELLRIICMLMIVCLHVFGKGGALDRLTPADINYYVCYGVESLFIVAVNCFILVSGYFGIKFNTKKLLSLTHQVWFYSLVIFIIFFSFFSIYDVNLGVLKTTLMPIVFNQWWFISTYVILYLGSPFLNILIENITKQQFQKVIILLFFVLCVLPTIMSQAVNNNYGYSISSFVFLYFIGRYIKLYTINGHNKYVYLFLYISFSALTFIFNYAFTLIKGKNIGFFFGYDTIFTFLGSIFLFLFFRGLNIKSSLINIISPLVLSVYIIHEHPFVRAYIWDGIFHCQDWIYSEFFIPYTIGTVVSIFIFCISVEFVRGYFTKNIEAFLIEKEINIATSILMKAKRYCSFQDETRV